MNILLTNDDGIYADGLWAMKNELEGQHCVHVVAPDTERSAIGHSITLQHPLRFSKIATNGDWGYAVNGTPADCVKLALQVILEESPDLVVSGINSGANVGINLNYSGTVSAAKEAALLGFPAIAVSQEVSERKYGLAASFTSALVKQVQRRGLPRSTFLNVNVPACAPEKIQGVSVTRQGLITPKETFHKRIDPRNETYYWQGADGQMFEDHADSDGAALCRKYISVTPIQCDMTDYETMDQLKTWDFSIKVWR